MTETREVYEIIDSLNEIGTIYKAGIAVTSKVKEAADKLSELEDQIITMQADYNALHKTNRILIVFKNKSEPVFFHECGESGVVEIKFSKNVNTVTVILTLDDGTKETTTFNLSVIKCIKTRYKEEA